MTYKPNDRLIRLTVAGVSLLVAVVLGSRLADEYFRLREDRFEVAVLEAELDASQSRDERLRRIETKLQEDHVRLVSRSTTPQQIQSVRDEVLRIVHDSGAKLRGLDVADGETRPWGSQGDDPRNRQPPDPNNESEFELHTHTLMLVADGTLPAILDICQRVRDHHWLMTIDSLKIKPLGMDGSSVALELEWSLYGLQRSAGSPHDET